MSSSKKNQVHITKNKKDKEKKVKKNYKNLLKKWFVKDANSFVTTDLQCCSYLDQCECHNEREDTTKIILNQMQAFSYSSNPDPNQKSVFLIFIASRS